MPGQQISKRRSGWMLLCAFAALSAAGAAVAAQSSTGGATVEPQNSWYAPLQWNSVTVGVVIR